MDYQGVKIGVLLLSLHVGGLTVYVLTYLLTTVAATCCHIILYSIILYLYTRVTMGFCTNNESMVGKYVIVTGGTSGIGLETARELAKKGANVIVGFRSDNPAIMDAVRQGQGGKNVEFWDLDLMKIESIRAFVEKVRSKRLKIDVLVNNAGIFKPKDLSYVEAGVGGILQGRNEKSIIQTNYLGHFELTILMKNHLSRNARIVNVSSCFNLFSDGNVDLDKIDYSDYVQVYCTSKLMTILFTRELNRRWGKYGVTSYSLHPGWVATNIFQWNTWRNLILLGASIFGKTPLQGCQTSVYLSTEVGIEEMSGQHFADCRSNWWTKVWTHSNADDSDLSVRLWDKSVHKMTSDGYGNQAVLDLMKPHVMSDMEMRIMKSGLDLKNLALIIKRRIGG